MTDTADRSGGIRLVVAGRDGDGASAQWRSADGGWALKREMKSVPGGRIAFLAALTDGCDQVDGHGDVYLQVRPGTEVDPWVQDWLAARAPERLAAYGVNLLVLDPEGNRLGSYRLGASS